MKSLLEAYAQMKSDTKLKGDQHKLDKNKNGKLDSDDFKKLRKEEQDPPFAGPYTTVKNNKNNGAQKARALAQKALKTAIIKGTEKYTSSPDKLKPKHFGMAEQFTEGYEEIKVHSKDGKHIGTITHGKYQSVAYAHPTTKFGGSKVPHPDEDSTTLAGPHETQKGIDYIHAHHRMMSEEVEGLDELSKSTLGSYVKKAAADATISRKVASDFEHMSARAKKPSMKASASELEKEYKSKSWKRRDNIGKAVDRLTKEEQMKTFKEFIEEAHEYKAGRYVHKGTYGSSHDDPGVKSKPFWQATDKDEDDKPKKAEAPAVKRGRGRPAGAKSGARQFGAAAKDGSGADYTGMKLHLPNSNR
jgi:hypothetical protein